MHLKVQDGDARSSRQARGSLAEERASFDQRADQADGKGTLARLSGADKDGVSSRDVKSVDCPCDLGRFHLHGVSEAERAGREGELAGGHLSPDLIPRLHPLALGLFRLPILRVMRMRQV